MKISLLNIDIVLCSLAFFFIFVIIISFLNKYEGFESNVSQYKKYDENDALILAQKNAGNIEYLKEKINDLQHLNDDVRDLSGNFVTLQKQVEDMLEAQQNYTQQISAPNVTGLEDDDNENNINMTT